MRLLKTSKSIRKEFKRQLEIAIIAAIGFTIAFAWKEAILKIMENTAINLGNLTNLGYSPLFMPILTTIIGVILIFILSRLFKS
jgi:hypothetical protein